MHPPFRWQRRYVEGFSEQVAELEASSDVLVAVENMFPFRTDRFFPGQSMERMRRRGGGPGPGISAFAPSYDPLDGNHAHYTLDLSHSATAGTDALDMAERMGAGLVHLHLCDGTGLPADEHLAPGRGNQPTVEVCQMLAAGDFAGHVILEVSTSSARAVTFCAVPSRLSSCSFMVAEKSRVRELASSVAWTKAAVALRTSATRSTVPSVLRVSVSISFLRLSTTRWLSPPKRSASFSRDSVWRASSAPTCSALAMASSEAEDRSAAWRRKLAVMTERRASESSAG